MAAATLDEIDVQLKAIINNLFMLITQAHNYQGSQTQQAMTAEIKDLVINLHTISQTAKRLPAHIPVEIIQYVENSRNPDIYTREFVELVMRSNQQQKGRSEALAQFRDILATKMASGIPEIREDIIKVVESSGGRLE